MKRQGCIPVTNISEFLNLNLINVDEYFRGPLYVHTCVRNTRLSREFLHLRIEQRYTIVADLSRGEYR